uniref:ABC transporter ATP-binding protein n=1 Tax=Waltera acetigignens TaxID=2981769 RepID=UPI003F7F8B89
MNKILVKAENVKKYYSVKNNNTLKALDGVSLEIYEQEILGIVGESGCGKSTLGKCLMKLTDVTSGKIIAFGRELGSVTGREEKELRKHMQMVFQNPFSSFNPKYSIGKSLGMVAEFYGFSKQQSAKRLEELMQVVGLDKSVMTRMPTELSGGQLQRLAIARALIAKPEFILADEPVSALDVSVQAQILNLLLHLKKKYGETIVFISHDLPVVEHICDRVVVMYLGSILEMGRAEDLFKAPIHPYTKALLAAKPKENPDVKKEEFTLKGDVPNAMEMPSGCKFHTRCPYAKEGLCDCKIPERKEISEGHFAACHFAQ